MLLRDSAKSGGALLPVGRSNTWVGSPKAAGSRSGFSRTAKVRSLTPAYAPAAIIADGQSIRIHLFKDSSFHRLINGPPRHATLPLDLTCRGDATGGDRWPCVGLQAVGSNLGYAPSAETGLARSTPWKPAPGRNPVSDLGMPKNPAVRRPEAVLVTTRGSPQRLPAASPPPRDPRRIFE